MHISEIRAKRDGSDNRLWWTSRYLEEVIRRRGAATANEKDEAAACFVTLANADPQWALNELAEMGPRPHEFGELLSGDRLTAALETLSVEPIWEDAMLRAKLLSGPARWERDEARREDLWRRAWQELTRIPEAARNAAWDVAALAPASRADFTSYKLLVRRHLERIPRPFDRGMFLPEAVSAAAKYRDWEQFEEWAQIFRALPEAFRHDHGDCAIWNLQGLRALDEGREDDALAAMREVLGLAPTLQFLSNEEVSSLPRRLFESGKAPELTSQFMDLVKQRDWRTHMDEFNPSDEDDEP